jgi:hypothetical protein
MIYTTLHRKLWIEQQKTRKKRGEPSVETKFNNFWREKQNTKIGNNWKFIEKSNIKTHMFIWTSRISVNLHLSYICRLNISIKDFNDSIFPMHLLLIIIRKFKINICLPWDLLDWHINVKRKWAWHVIKWTRPRPYLK